MSRKETGEEPSNSRSLTDRPGKDQVDGSVLILKRRGRLADPDAMGGGIRSWAERHEARIKAGR